MPGIQATGEEEEPVEQHHVPRRTRERWCCLASGWFGYVWREFKPGVLMPAYLESMKDAWWCNDVGIFISHQRGSFFPLAASPCGLINPSIQMTEIRLNKQASKQTMHERRQRFSRFVILMALSGCYAFVLVFY